MNSDDQAKVLKSQGKNAARDLIGNQTCRALANRAAASIEAGQTPRGGGRAGGLPPLSERPFDVSGLPEVEK